MIIAEGHSIASSDNFVFDFSTDERHEFEDEDALADDDGETSGDNPATSGSRGSAYGGGNELFQSQFQLHTVQQKLNQIVLLQVSLNQKMNPSASLVQKSARKGGDMMVSRPKESHNLGLFPFVRTDRPDPFLRNENFTINQNYPARSVKS